MYSKKEKKMNQFYFRRENELKKITFQPKMRFQPIVKARNFFQRDRKEEKKKIKREFHCFSKFCKSMCTYFCILLTAMTEIFSVSGREMERRRNKGSRIKRFY